MQNASPFHSDNAQTWQVILFAILNAFENHESGKYYSPSIILFLYIYLKVSASTTSLQFKQKHLLVLSVSQCNHQLDNFLPLIKRLKNFSSPKCWFCFYTSKPTLHIANLKLVFIGIQFPKYHFPISCYFENSSQT